MVEYSVRHHNKTTIGEEKFEPDGLGMYILSPVRLTVLEVVLTV